jgi:hypothetical protein
MSFIITPKRIINIRFRGHPLKGPVKNKHYSMAKISSFFAGHTLYSRHVFVLSFSCALIFNCFRVAALFDPHQSPIRIKIELRPSYFTVPVVFNP